MGASNVLVVEDDRFLRVVGIVLDPATSRERFNALDDIAEMLERLSRELAP